MLRFFSRLTFLKYFAGFSVGIFFILPLFAQAALTDCPTKTTGDTKEFSGIEVKVSIPGVTKDCHNSITNKDIHYVDDLQSFLATMYKFLVGIAGILAVIMMMVGGYYWLFAAGNSSMVQKAKDLIINSAFGLFLALGSYTLLVFINPDLVQLKPLDFKTPSSINIGQATKICSLSVENGVRSHEETKNFGCGSVYYPHFHDYETANCAGDLGKSDECQRLKNQAFTDGCMGVTCPSSPVSKICSIQSDKNGNLLSGGCVSSVNARTIGTKVVSFTVDPDDGQICGGANLTLTDEVDPKCNDGASSTSCTLVTEPNFDTFYKPDIPLTYIEGWGGRIVGSYKGAELSMRCRSNFPASMIYAP